MIYYLPIFLQKDKIKEALEALNGIALRFQNANHIEQSRVIPFILQIDNKKDMETEINKFKEEPLNCHIGIALMDSDFICNINKNNIKDFILLAPVASGKIIKDNIFQFMLSEWEAMAIKKVLENCSTEESDWKILTDLEKNTKYLKSFLDCLKCDSNYEVLNSEKFNWKTLPLDKEGYIVVGKNKWKIIRKLRKILKESLKEKIIVTTSSFEDWKKTPVKRKIYAEGVMYTYPKLSEVAKNVIESFQKEFGFKPSIYHLLAYDGVSLVIKTLLDAGPGYSSMKHFLAHEQFETIVSGKIGFSEKENSKYEPYLIGKSPKDLFEIKYVDEEGEYKSLDIRR